MRSYIIKRLIYSVIIAWGILTITFILLRVGPTSPVDRYILNIAARGQDVESVRQAIEARYGLDKPIIEQYFAYMGNLLQGKWGWSFSASQPVHGPDRLALDLFISAYPAVDYFCHNPRCRPRHAVGS